jgi:hypothetical protein
MIFFHLSTTWLSDLYITKNCIFCWYTTAKKRKCDFFQSLKCRQFEATVRKKNFHVSCTWCKSLVGKFPSILKLILMPYLSIGPKWFWTVQIVLVRSKSFWLVPNHFGRVQIILVRFKLYFYLLFFIIWTCPKWFEPDQNDLNPTKTNWACPKWLVLDQTDLDGPKSFWAHRRTRQIVGSLKGQLISKGNFGVFKSTKKPTNFV